MTTKKKRKKKRGRAKYGKMLEPRGLRIWKSAPDDLPDEGTECQVIPFEKGLEELGLVFGWASICKDSASARSDRDHVDRHKDRISENGLLKAALHYVDKGAVAKAMHRGRQVGDVPFVFPLTEDIKKALGLQGQYSGLLIGMRPNAQTLAKFKNGSLTCFSIGGRLRQGIIEQ